MPVINSDSYVHPISQVAHPKSELAFSNPGPCRQAGVWGLSVSTQRTAPWQDSGTRPKAGQECPHPGPGAFGVGLAQRPKMCRKKAGGISGAPF